MARDLQTRYLMVSWSVGFLHVEPVRNKRPPVASISVLSFELFVQIHERGAVAMLGICQNSILAYPTKILFPREFFQYNFVFNASGI